MSPIRQLILIDSLGLSYASLHLDGHTLLQDDQQGIADAVSQLIGLVYTGLTEGITADTAAFKQAYFPLPTSGIVFEIETADKRDTLALHWVKGDIQWTLIQHGYEEEFFLKKGKALPLHKIPTQLRARDMVFEHMNSAQYQEVLFGQVPKWERFALAKGRPPFATQQLIKLLNAPLPIPSEVMIDSLLYDQPRIPIAAIIKKLTGFYANWETWQQVNAATDARREALDRYDQYLDRKTQLSKLAYDIQALLPLHKDALNLRKQEWTQLLAEQSTLEAEIHQQQRAFQLREQQLMQAQAIADYMLGIAAEEHHTTDVFSAQFLVALGEILSEAQDLPLETIGQQAAIAALDRTIQQAELSREKAQLVIAQNWQNDQREKLSQHTQSLQAGWQEIQALKQQLDTLIQQKHEAAITAAQASSQDSLYDNLIQIAKQKAEADQAMALAQSEIAAHESQQSLELALHQLQKEAAQAPLTNKISQLEAEIEALTDKIDKRQAAFYGWLDTRYPGWQKTIGKVVKEEVLFDPHLSPNVVRLNDLLYGIHLDLDELDTKAPTQEELFQAKKDAQATLATTQRELESLIQKQEKNQLSIERRYRQKIRQAQKALQLARAASEQFDLQFKKIQAQQKTSPDQVAAQQQIVQLAYQIESQTHLIKEAEARQEAQLEHLDAPESAIAANPLEAPYQTQVDKATADKKVLLEKWEQLMVNSTTPEDGLRTWAKEFVQTQQHELSEPISLLLASRLPRWKIQALKSQQALATLRLQHADQTAKSEAAQHRLSEQVKTLQAQIETLNRDSQRLETLRPLINASLLPDQATPEPDTDYTGLSAAINQFVLRKGEADQLQAQALKRIAPLGSVLVGNPTYQAPSTPPDEASLADWIDCLRVLNQLETLDQIETSIGEQYAALIHQVVEETHPAFQWESKAKQRLSSWQARLNQTENFPFQPTVELSISHSPWVETLREIHTFVAEHGHQIGAASLFNQTVAGERNREAVSLLARWITQLQQWNIAEIHPQHLLALRILPSEGPLRKSQALQRLAQIWTCGSLLTASGEFPPMRDLALIHIDMLHRPYWLSWLAAMDQEGSRILASSTHGLGAAFFQTIYQFQVKDGAYKVVCLKQP